MNYIFAFVHRISTLDGIQLSARRSDVPHQRHLSQQQPGVNFTNILRAILQGQIPKAQKDCIFELLGFSITISLS